MEVLEIIVGVETFFIKNSKNCNLYISHLSYLYFNNFIIPFQSPTLKSLAFLSVATF